MKEKILRECVLQLFYEEVGAESIVTHLRTSQMSKVVEPVHVGPAVVEGVDELVCDHSVHMSLLVDVVLTQNNLEAHTQKPLKRQIASSQSWTACSIFLLSYLRGGCVEPSADRPVTVFTGEMPVFEHLAVFGRHVFAVYLEYGCMCAAELSFKMNIMCRLKQQVQL